MVVSFLSDNVSECLISLFPKPVKLDKIALEKPNTSWKSESYAISVTLCRNIVSIGFTL